MSLFRTIFYFFLTLTFFAVENVLAEDAAFKAARPILEANCVECHGGQSVKGGLRISTREDLLGGGEEGKVVVPGDPQASSLYKRITHAESPGMPYKREKLSEADIAKIAAWIKAGANYDEPLAAKSEEQFWSLKPLQKPVLPKIKSKSWPKTPVDTFILSKLEEEKMKPSEPADKRTLLRRVTFDLVGLPPTPEEMKDFLADKSADAFTKVVDRLLASPRYGERWARHWLDVVHYGDSHGHDEDALRRNAWPYRDYLIRSFNDDKPYSRFVEEQLAGDALFPEDPNGIVATGFIVAGPWDQSSLQGIMEDTVDRKIGRYLDRDDMLMNAISTFTSSTVHCARCHNHKFDPISQNDYYSLQAVFAGIDRAERPYDLDPKTNVLRQALLRKKTLLDIKDPRIVDTLLQPQIQAKVVAWEKTFAGEGVWTVLEPTNFTASSGATLTKQKDFSLLASGEDPLIDTYTITAHTDLKNISAVRVEVLTDATHPRNGPGRNPDNGNFHLSEFKVFAAPRDSTNFQAVALQNPSADFNQENWTIEKTIDGDTNTAWGIYPETGKPHFAFYELKENLGFDGGTTLTFSLQQLHGRKHTILRPRVSVTTISRPVKAPVAPENVRKSLAISAAERTDEQKRELAAHVLKEEVEKEIAALPKPLMVYAAANDFPQKSNFLPAKKPREIHVLKRGDVTRPLEAAGPGALSCVTDVPSRFDVSDPNDEGARRAALAKWIINPKNVLAWRSIVNRVWHYHFGKGIVDTPNDFGRMGSLPTHPELLDWLAIWFQENDGSLKKLHRLILTSAVYQQSSENNKRYAEMDSGNSYLWRMNRNRLDAESVRDSVLQLAGKIDLTMGGPPVKQFYIEEPKPDNTPVVDYGRFNVDSPENFRRSVYRMIIRAQPDPFMDALDCADASQLTAVRNVSMTALQALAMWNNAFVVRQSEHFAARVATAGSLKEQIKAAFQLALGRDPSAGEVRDLSRYAQKHGMANVCRLILNSNEFVFVN